MNCRDVHIHTIACRTSSAFVLKILPKLKWNVSNLLEFVNEKVDFSRTNDSHMQSVNAGRKGSDGTIYTAEKTFRIVYKFESRAYRVFKNSTQFFSILRQLGCLMLLLFFTIIW